MTVTDYYDIYQKLCSEVNVQQSGQIRPVSDFQNWMNSISDDMFHEKCAAYQLNQMNSDELAPFTVRKYVIVSPQSNQPFDRIDITGISDYQYLKGIRVLRNLIDESDGILADGNCVKYVDPDFQKLIQAAIMQNKYEADVVVIDSDRWSATLDSITKKPNFQKPKCTQDSQGFLLAPKGIHAVVVEYFRTPVKSIFAYTYGTGDIVVFDPVNSVAPEWSRVLENEFLTRLMKKYGVRVRDAEVFQAGDANKKELV